MSQSRTPTLAKGVQDALEAHLKALPVFIGVDVIGRRKGTVVNDILAAVKKNGACIYVFPALPIRINSDNPGPYVGKLAVRVRAIEQPQLNAKAPDAYEITELLLREMDALQLTVGGTPMNPLYFESGPVEPADDGELVMFDVVAFTSGGLQPRA